MGYFVGCDSESIYRIYSEEKHKVFRIGVARVDDGEGLQDPHDSPSMTTRNPVPSIDLDETHSWDSNSVTSNDRNP
jgi:hypothetical protein